MNLVLPRLGRHALRLGLACLTAWGLWEMSIVLTPLPPALAHGPPSTPVIVDTHGVELAQLSTTAARLARPVPLAQMGVWLPEFTLQLEDRRFYQHCGIDWQRVLAAGWQNIRNARTISGASTITQQLIKLASGSRTRSFSTKIYEMVAAIKLERQWSKERILEDYLNRCDYGNRLVGPVAASRQYFRKLPRDLTRSEALYLAGLPQSPTRRNPWLRPVNARGRYEWNRSRVAPDLTAAAPEIQPPNWPRVSAPHFVDAVRKQLPATMSGVIATTLDAGLQRLAEDAVRDHLRGLVHRGVEHAAVVILDAESGAVRAMIGSADYRASCGQNNAAIIPRSSGSTLKPFLYLRALDERVLTAASLLPDTPDAVRAEFTDYDPINYDHRYLGPVRLREALACSLNVPAVVTASQLGARRVYEGLERAGIQLARGFNETGAGFILGNADVRLVDLAAAFAGFARDGMATTARLLADEPARHRAISTPEAAWIISDVLSDNEARVRSFGFRSPLAFDALRIPVKTGTSSGFRDAWTVGATNRHVVAVWAGRFDGKPMLRTAAIQAAAPLWRALVDQLLERGDTGLPDIRTRTGLRRVSVCTRTGLLPCPASAGRLEEHFLPGTEPTTDATAWFVQKDQRQVLQLPEKYRLWCSSGFNHLGAEVASSPSLVIHRPGAGARFLLDSRLPADRQQIAMSALGAPPNAISWTVDDRPVPLQYGQALWQLKPGRHIVRAFAPGIQSAAVEIVVQAQ